MNKGHAYPRYKPPSPKKYLQPQSPIPNPQSPIPNPQSPIPIHIFNFLNIVFNKN